MVKTTARNLALLLTTFPILAAAESAEGQAHDKVIKLSQAPAVIFFALYLAMTVVHWLRMTIGMALGMDDNYAWQLLPGAFLAFDYVVLKHLARACGPAIATQCLFLPARGIVWIFLLSDLVTFCAQTVGTSLGEKLAIAGLVLQLLSFGLYTALLYVSSRRLSRHYPELYRPPEAGGNSFRLWSVQPVNDASLLVREPGVTCIAILIRSIFRLVEQADGYVFHLKPVLMQCGPQWWSLTHVRLLVNLAHCPIFCSPRPYRPKFFGFVATHEVCFYVFDATPLWPAMSLFAVVWPARYIAGIESKIPDSGRSWQTGKVEMGPLQDPAWSGSGRVGNGRFGRT
ncbi:hypothetical protein JCM11641_003019 [Rhodosporidiobolus odoratus]